MTIRTNQQQVNVDGKHVGKNRPDLQYTYNGKRYYEEYDTPASKRGVPHLDRVLSNDPDSVIGVIRVP